MADPRAAELAMQLDRAFETSVNEPSLRHPPPFATQTYGDVANIPEAPALYIPGSLINAAGPVPRSSLEVQLRVARELVETADADVAAATPRGPESVVAASSGIFQAAHDTAYTTSRAPLVALVDETESLAAQVRALQRSLHARIGALSSPEYRPSLRVEVQTFLQVGGVPLGWRNRCLQCARAAPLLPLLPQLPRLCRPAMTLDA